MFGRKKIEVNAVLDEDMEFLLKETNQYEELIKGNLNCISCGTLINSTNIGVMVPIEKSGEIKLNIYCERIDCAERYKHDIK